MNDMCVCGQVEMCRNYGRGKREHASGAVGFWKDITLPGALSN